MITYGTFAPPRPGVTCPVTEKWAFTRGSIVIGAHVLLDLQLHPIATRASQMGRTKRALHLERSPGDEPSASCRVDVHVAREERAVVAPNRDHENRASTRSRNARQRDADAEWLVASQALDGPDRDSRGLRCIRH